MAGAHGVLDQQEVARPADAGHAGGGDGARAGDADLRELSAVAEAERLAGVRGMIAALVGKAALRDDLDPDEAADIAWALISPEMWQLLTQRRGWDPARYQAWLGRSLRDSLLG